MYATEHRCGLKVSGPGLSYHISGQDPLHDNKPLQRVEATLKGNSKAEFTAKLVQSLSECIIECLRSHPINVKRK